MSLSIQIIHILWLNLIHDNLYFRKKRKKISNCSEFTSLLGTIMFLKKIFWFVDEKEKLSQCPADSQTHNMCSIKSDHSCSQIDGKVQLLSDFITIELICTSCYNQSLHYRHQISQDWNLKDYNINVLQQKRTLQSIFFWCICGKMCIHCSTAEIPPRIRNKNTAYSL